MYKDGRDRGGQTEVTSSTVGCVPTDLATSESLSTWISIRSDR